MTSILQSYRQSGIFYITLGATMLSFSPVLFVYTDASPIAGAFYRMLFGGSILMTIALIKKEKLWQSKKHFFLICTCSVFFALDLSFWHTSINYLGVGFATLIGNFQVFVLAAYGIIVVKEKLNWRLVLSVPLAFLGLMMIIGFNFSGLHEEIKTGLLYGIFTALSFGFFLLALRKTQKIENPLSHRSNIAQLSIVCSGILLIFALVSGQSLAIVGIQSLLALIGYGLFGQVFGHMLISKGLFQTPPSVAGLLHLLQPALAYIWDISLFARDIQPMEIAGFVLTLFAVYLGSTTKKEPEDTEI